MNSGHHSTIHSEPVPFNFQCSTRHSGALNQNSAIFNYHVNKDDYEDEDRSDDSKYSSEFKSGSYNLDGFETETS